MKKRILIVTEYFYPEEFKINDLAMEWKEKGYDVDVLTQFPTYPFGKIYDGYENRWYRKDTYKGINIYRVKAVTGYKDSLFKKLLKYFSFMFLGSIVSLKIGKKYDYVFGFDIAALTSMVPASLLKKFYNKKVTLWVQDVWPDSVYAYGFKKTKILQYVLDGLVRFVYKNSTNIAVSGEGFIKKVRPYCDVDKEIRYYPNWAEELEDNPKIIKLSDDNKIHFTFAGNVGKVQNLDNIIKAFGNLTQEYFDKAQLNIIGDGSHLSSLKELVSKNDFKSIVFWGRKESRDMSIYYKESDVLIVSLVDKPIFELTIPSKLQTYIAAQKPIFSVVNGDVSNMVNENKLGFCANPSDISDITLGFEKFIDMDEIQKNEFIHKSEDLIHTTFNKENIINSLLKLLTR